MSRLNITSYQTVFLTSLYILHRISFMRSGIGALEWDFLMDFIHHHRVKQSVSITYILPKRENQNSSVTLSILGSNLPINLDYSIDILDTQSHQSEA